MDLIRTKLVVPSRRPGWLPRPRLAALLEAEAAVVLVRAPAGYGKTTLLAEWARARKEAGWISLDESDDDPARLVSLLSAATGAAEGGAGGPLAALVDALAARGRFVLVVDDAHLLRSRGALDVLTSLAERLPAQATLALGSRGGPELPWARWRARGRLLEIGPAELRLSPDETAGVVARMGGPELGADEAALLDARVEGWAAGVVLAAQALAGRERAAGRTGVSAYLRDVRAAHRWALDFLLDEVLSRRPPEDQELLMRTSVLERVSAGLAALLADDPDAERRFDSLTRDGLFLMDLDGRGEWFRYHSLFAEMLRLRLRHRHPGLETVLRRRAAERLEADGDLAAAVEQRFATGEAAEAARLLESISEDTLARGEIETFLGWTERLPPELLAERPGLLVRRAFCLLLQGRSVAEVESALAGARAESGGDSVRALLALYRGDLDGAEEWAAGAARLTGTIAAFARVTLAAVRRDKGGDAEAKPLLEEVARGPSPFGATMAMVFLSVLQARAGDLDGARRLCERALGLAVDPQGRRLPVSGRCLAGLALIAIERDELEEAERNLRESLASSEVAMRGISSGVYASLARVRAALGEAGDAEHLLERARELARQFDLTQEDDLYVEMEAARLELDRGNLAKALTWADRNLGVIRSGLATRRSAKYEAAVAARVLLDAHREAEALELVVHVLALPASSSRPILRAELELIRAGTLASRGSLREARAAARACLSLAARIGLNRLLREAPPVTRSLLRQAAEEAGGEELAWYRDAAARLEARKLKRAQPGGLSPREREVLPYLRSDLTAREIGERLYVSEQTVKSHLKSIYAKLEVRGRAGAVEKAETLGLLSSPGPR